MSEFLYRSLYQGTDSCSLFFSKFNWLLLAHEKCANFLCSGSIMMPIKQGPSTATFTCSVTTQFWSKFILSGQITTIFFSKNTQLPGHTVLNTFYAIRILTGILKPVTTHLQIWHWSSVFIFADRSTSNPFQVERKAISMIIYPHQKQKQRDLNTEKSSRTEFLEGQMRFKPAQNKTCSLAHNHVSVRSRKNPLMSNRFVLKSSVSITLKLPEVRLFSKPAN